MIYLGKYRILKNLIVACDYDYLLKQIQKYISRNKNLLISPIASQTLVKSFFDAELNSVLNKFDYLVPDSQWVKKTIKFLYGAGIQNRVYGPNLMLKVCELSEEKKYKIFLYGNQKVVLKKLKEKLKEKFPKIIVVGSMPSVFRSLTRKDFKEINKKIDKLNTDIVFICLGSPFQEVTSFNLLKNRKSKKGLVIIPVGAAFDFISGVKPQAPLWIQNSGLEWLFRLTREPRRLWKRYLIYGHLFILLIFYQKLLISIGRKNIFSNENK